MAGMCSSNLVVLFTLFMASAVQAQYGYGGGGYYGGGSRLAGGTIAGIVIACVVFWLLVCLCCTMCIRRRRAGVHPIPFYRGGQYGNAGAMAPRNVEAGYPGATQPGWNNGAQPAVGGYDNSQAPIGEPAPPYGSDNTYAAPPGAPPAAHTKWGSRQ